MTDHVFDSALALTPQADGSWLGHTQKAWWNMVGPFGGISAALAVSAITRDPRCLGQPVSLTVNFLAGLVEGPFCISTRITRTNRSSQHWMLEMSQPQADGSSALVLTGTAITAVRREAYSATVAPFPQVEPAHTLPRWRVKVAMEWLERYDMRVLQGIIPAMDAGPEAVEETAPNNLTRLWANHVPPRPMDYPALAAMADVFYPRIWLQRPRFVPAGTVSMTVYFHANHADLAATGANFVLCEAHAQAFRDGHFDQTARLWNEAGTLLASSHQLVYYKE